MMTNVDPYEWIFLSHPHTNNVFFLSKLLYFYFKSHILSCQLLNDAFTNVGLEIITYFDTYKYHHRCYVLIIVCI